MSDPHNLHRFIEAQQGEYETALAELHAGEKHEHWMWFIFPQYQGLGRSPVAEEFAIKSLHEARAYLDHERLGERLRECTLATLAVEDRTAEQIFGFPDFLKFRSSMTLFDHVSTGDSCFGRAIDRFYDGPDQRTLELTDGEAAQ